MSGYLAPLLVLQPLFKPALVVILLWACWRTVFTGDLAVGLALYLALVIIVDGYFNTGIYLPGLEKGSIRYSEACALFLIFKRPPIAGQEGPPRRAATWLLGLYFLLLFLSALRTTPIVEGVFEFRRLIVSQIVAFTVAKRGLGSTESFNRFVLCMTAVVLIIGAFDFWDVFFDRWLLKSEMLDKPIYYHNRELNRFGSLFLNPNYFGAFIVLVFPIVFVWVLNELRVWKKLVGFAGLGMLAFCLVETQSRGPLIAFGIGLFILMIGPGGRVSRVRRVGLFATMGLAMLLVMPGFFSHAVARFSELDKETQEGRSRGTTWLYTVRMIEDHPLAGIGFGEHQFMRFMKAYGFVDEFGLQPLDAPHNSYLQVAVYAGLPALGLLLLANGVLLVRAAMVCLRGAAGPDTPMVFGLLVGVVSFLACTTTDLHLFTQSTGPLFFVWFGLLLSRVAAANGASTQSIPVLPASRVA